MDNKYCKKHTLVEMRILVMNVDCCPLSVMQMSPFLIALEGETYDRQGVQWTYSYPRNHTGKDCIEEMDRSMQIYRHNG